MVVVERAKRYCGQSMQKYLRQVVHIDGAHNDADCLRDMVRARPDLQIDPGISSQGSGNKAM